MSLSPPLKQNGRVVERDLPNRDRMEVFGGDVLEAQVGLDVLHESVVC